MVLRMRGRLVAVGVLAFVVATLGCGDSSDNTGAAGSGGAGTTGAAGSDAAAGAAGADAGSDATDSATSFQALDPCSAAGDYAMGTAITVSADAGVLGYMPKCLKVEKGAAVQIGANEAHPLSGTDAGTPGNPIPIHQTDDAIVNFPVPGFFTFQCDVHADAGMKGVVWVTP